jgi:hypothetical protein
MVFPRFRAANFGSADLARAALTSVKPVSVN